MFSSRFGKSVGLLAACFFFAAATTAQSPDTANARPSASQERPKAQSLNASASESITKDQADAIVSELKLIRQLLERQQVQLARAMAPQPSPHAPPEKVQMSLASGSFSIGRADAPITLVEFADFQCPYCKRFHTGTFAELKKNYIDTGKLRFVSRDLPLDFHPFALRAAEAARCAGDQQKYWELRDALFANAAVPNDDAINRAVETLALDKKAFQACLDSDKYKSEIQKDATEAALLHIDGTPSFVLGKTSGNKLDGIVLVGAQPYTSFDSAIQQMLKASYSALNGKGN
jgi:protein-disulfide isomerase